MGKFFKLLAFPALLILSLFFVKEAFASWTASEFSKWCAKNPTICKKVDFDNARSGSVTCPGGELQEVLGTFVHAGDGKTVYEMPHDGFWYYLSNNNSTANVSLTTHPHDISWIGVHCGPKPSPTPTPTECPTVTPSPTPTLTPSPTPSPTPTETPTPTPTEEPSPTPTEVEPSPTLTLTPTPKEIGGPAGAPVCNDPVPPAPTIVSVTRIDADSFKVVWTKVNPASSYSIVYGPSGNYLYSVFDTGNTDNFVINGVSSACFAVKAVNGCMPGPLSAEVCSGAVAGKVLGATTLGATGSFDWVNLAYAAGFLLSGLGVRKNLSKRLE